MKIVQQILSSKVGPFVVMFIILLLVSDWISNRPEPKTTRQIGSSSNPVQALWVKDIYLFDYVTNWNSNTLYVAEQGTDQKLLAIDSLRGTTIWEVLLTVHNKNGDFNQFGVDYLLTANQTVFTVTSTSVNAYRMSTGELIWSTRLGDGHVSIYPQMEDSVLRVYYGDKIFEISQASGEILAVLQKSDIVWIQNNVEVHCPLPAPQDEGAVPSCWIGLTGIDRVTRKNLWKNKYAHFSEYFQEQTVNNMVLTGFSEDGICALKPDTGEHTWCLPVGKISNIALSEDNKIGYYLRNDFSLVKINLSTGGIVSETKFLPKTLPAEMQKQSYGYRVAVTKDTVIVSFGDSDQTFGLKISP
jgi:outer membrane protein assembly factor BamB